MVAGVARFGFDDGNSGDVECLRLFLQRRGGLEARQNAPHQRRSEHCDVDAYRNPAVPEPARSNA